MKGKDIPPRSEHWSWAGFLFGLVSSLIISLLITVFANLVAGGASFGGWSWFLITLVVPLTICFAAAESFLFPPDAHTLKFWGRCAVAGFLIVLYMGTIGAIVSSAIAFGGISHVNVNGYLGWGVVYAVCTLPLSTVVLASLVMIYGSTRRKR